MSSSLPIGVFDSGLGGLTVVRALRQQLPQEHIAYFGDTARLPYGSKSPATVHRFARQCLTFLMGLKPKLLVVACNTVSALALDKLKTEFSVPIVGVVEPGARAAVEAAAPGSRIGLIATEATINSNAYVIAIQRLNPQLHILGRACPLLVPIIEEGREPTDPVVQLVLHDYLRPFMELGAASLILGCTHYPILTTAIQNALGPKVTLIDSAAQTALVVRQMLAGMTSSPESSPRLAGGSMGSLTCYVTDQGQRFERLASRFLGQPVSQPVWVTPEMLESTP